MKRKQTDSSADPAKKLKDNHSTGIPVVPSPNVDNQERKCGCSPGEKVIGFFGGWPYVGMVSAVETVRMSFGITFFVLVRWNGFSGKNAQSWVSELDVMTYDDESIKMKQAMEDSLRQRTKEAGGKLTALENRKVVTEIVQDYRGKKLAPLRPQTCPFGDEWQTIVRVAAMPKQLVEHLQGTETLIYERKVCFLSSNPSVEETLGEWLELNDDQAHRAYAETMMTLFNSYLPKLLIYRFEIPLVFKRVIEHGNDNYAALCTIEYYVRFCNLFPQILTAACNGLMGKSDTPVMKTFFSFVNSHQSFMQFLVLNIDRLLRVPRKAATLDEPAPELHWIGTFTRNETSIVDFENLDAEAADVVKKQMKRRISLKSKHKGRTPSFRPPKLTDISCL